MKSVFFGMTLSVMGLVAWVAFAKINDEGAFYRDIRPQHWSWNGSDIELIERVFTKMRQNNTTRSPGVYIDTIAEFGPGNWTFEFEQLGDRYQTRAEQQLDQGLNGAAAHYFNKAAGYYSLGKYPYMRDDIHQARVYQKNLKAVEKAWTTAGRKMDWVTSTLDNKDIDGILYLPSGPRPSNGWPLVIGLNGLDVFKGEFFSFPARLADQGIAFLAIDLLGTGSHNNFGLGPDNDRLVSAFLDVMENRADIDGDRVALYGVSFSGNTVSKLAFTEEKRLSAVVNMCGPIHDIFMIDAEGLANILPMYVDSFRDRTMMEAYSDEEIAAYIKGFSLVNQGLVGPGRPRTSVPILSVNAKADPIAPESDMKLIARASMDGRIFYSGANDHCPQDRFTVMPMVADFLKQHLIEEQIAAR